MAKKVNRTCITCSKQYSYCNSCSEDRNKEPWYAIYCSDNCRKIFMAVTDYLANEITKEQTKEILDSCGLSEKEKYNGKIPTVINELYNIKSTEIKSVEVTVDSLNEVQEEIMEKVEVVENTKYKTTKKK